MIVNLQPLFDQVVFPIIAALALPMVAWAVKRIADLAHVQMTEKMAQTVETAMQSGINFALSRAQTVVDARASVDVKNQAIADAVQYVLPKVPAALTKLGITPQGLAQRIEARLYAKTN